MRLRRWILPCALLALWADAATAQEFIGHRLEQFTDTSASPLSSASQIGQAQDGWSNFDADVPNLGVSSEVHWIRLKLDPELELGQLIEVQNATLDELHCYILCDGDLVTAVGHRETLGAQGDLLRGNYPSFEIPMPDCDEVVVIFRVKSGKQLLFPVRITGVKSIMEDSHRRDTFFAAYFGVILVMLLYNLFLFMSVGDRNYLQYTIYILTVGGTQAVLNGYHLSWTALDFPWIEGRIVHLFGAFSGMATIVFARNFLNLRKNLRLLDRVLLIYFALEVVAVVLVIAGQLVPAYNLINVCAMGSMLLLPGAFIEWYRGYSPAAYFLLAFSVFIAAVVIFVLKDLGVIPYNLWTFLALPVGSAIEVVLLSLALASRINQLKRESAKAKENQLQVSMENERMVREQNQELELAVDKRTQELTVSNEELNLTLTELQTAQQQLVQSEKLASIGQLTAGIAHELNNPINFVSSSAQSLRRDFEDLNQVVEAVKELRTVMDSEELAAKRDDLSEMLKRLDVDFTTQEIEELLSGIEDGARRTSEIVKGLRIFSRMDGDNFMEADINELLQSTLVVLRSQLREKTLLETSLAEDLPNIKCQPGRLNQVFMNMITNAAQAIESSGKSDRDGLIRIVTGRSEIEGAAFVEVSISDNGVGMSESVQAQIFDPFYTTKGVGEGTGLGLSIVTGILSDHQAAIEIDSEVGIGTTFVLRFPV